MCKAELEQAHGRIRAVHRTKPGRALHIGNVMPSGSGWRLDRVEVRGAAIPGINKRPHGTDLLSIVTSLGGITPAAGLAGVSARTMARYLTGESTIPAGVLRELSGWVAI
jgi:hypothetical protein